MHVLLQDVRDNKAEAASAAPQALRLCQMVRFIICCHKRQTCQCHKRQTCQCYAIWCCCPLAAMTSQPVTTRLCLLSCDCGWENHVLLLKKSKMGSCVDIDANSMLMRRVVMHSLTKIGLFSHCGAVLVLVRLLIVCQCHMSCKHGRQYWHGQSFTATKV